MNPTQLLEHFDRIAEAPDAVPRLRRFILDLAVRGKLVEQDPNDEPASELLKRIQAEKARSVKAGEIRKQKILPPIHPEDIPVKDISGWIWVRLGDASTVITKGSTPTSYGHAYTAEGVNFVKVESIKNGLLLPENVTSFITNETHEFLGRSRLADSDILFSIAGSIGTCAVVSERLLPANTNQALAIIRGTRTAFHSQFLLKSLQSSIAGSVLEKARGGAMNNVSLEDIQNFVVPLPPLAEQHRIVAKIEELMALCDRLEEAQNKREQRRDRLAAASLNRIKQPAPPTEVGSATAFRENARFHLDHLPRLTTRPEHIKSLRQTILQLAVRGRLVTQVSDERPPNLAEQATRNAGEGKLDLCIPTNWRWARVSEVASSRLGKMLDKVKNRGSSYPYLRNTNVHWFEVRTDDLKQILLADDEVEQYLLRTGDVLICEGGHGIGRSAVWRGAQEPMAFQKALHRVRPGEHLHSEFFAFCCFVYFHEGIMQTYFTGVGIPHFTGRALSQLIFPLPPIAEQCRIVAKVDELMAVCDQLEAQLTTTQTDSRRLLEAVLHEALAPAEERELTTHRSRRPPPCDATGEQTPTGFHGG